MEPSRSKRRRLMQSYILPRTDLPAIFESLNDDTLTTVLEFVGNKSYKSFGAVNKHCREIYLNAPGMKKETFLFGYGPLSVILDRIERATASYYDRKLFECMGKGVVLYNRRDVLEWALEERKDYLLERICDVAGEEGRLDILVEVWNNVNDEVNKKKYIFREVDISAARGGKLNVLKWIFGKGLCDDDLDWCTIVAAENGHIDIIDWLRKEQGLELDGVFYNSAINGNQLHVLRWLRDQNVPWRNYNFRDAACGKGNLDGLQWLHDEGCPWPRNYRLGEKQVKKPECLEWLRANGYGDRINMRR